MWLIFVVPPRISLIIISSLLHGFVPEEGGDGVDVNAVFKKAHSEGVAEAVKGDMLLYLCEFE